MTDKIAKKWNDEVVAQLLSIVGGESPVSSATVEKAAEALGVSVRSVASKLRSLEHDVASLAKEKTATFTPEEGDALSKFVSQHTGTLTYKQIAEQFSNGQFNAKQVQGKILALELTEHVKPAEKVEVARTYSVDEEALFIKMVNAGSFIEEIAVALNKSVQSVRGKALSLTRSGQIEKIPAQKESHAKDTVDPVEALGAKISGLTVAEIAKAVDKTERGIKTLLTRRGINVADYNGADKKAKAEAKAAA
jgi:DNA-binding Lrp family transcriptional regulator